MSTSQDEQPIAGPSSRPWIAFPGWNWDAWQQGALGNQYARDAVGKGMKRRRTRKGGLRPRQDAPSPTAPGASPSPAGQPEEGQGEAAATSAVLSDSSVSGSAPSPSPSVDPSPPLSPSSTGPPPLFTGSRTDTPADSSSLSSSLSSVPPDSAPIYTSSSLPWSTRSRSSAPVATPTFVPGVTLNMTLGGDSDVEAVYAISVELGHGPNSKRRKRQGPGSGGLSQLMNVQIDLGSSDMWLAAGDCSSSACSGFNMLFDDSQSLDSGVDANFTYQTGAIAGDIYWEQVTVGTFQIGYQAFISATTVVDQDLINGNFTGVIGLAFPAASTIQTRIPGTTSSNPDGATFLDNLFGSGIYAPTNRQFSMALERREDVRTRSLFTIGQTSDRLCPEPCSPELLSVIPQSRLGATGFMHWRIPLLGVTATTWADEEDGEGPTDVNVPLGPSFAESSRTSPLAVLDSGGVPILVARRSYADAIYSAYGISASSDGLYRLPCKTPLSLTFDFGGAKIPLHPLDMTYPDPSDPSQNTCIGMIQYADNLGNNVGDFVLGSSFLKNAYSIFNYPDQVRFGRWQPTVGMIPLTNASVASRDFYAVRTNRQSLRTVSSDEDYGTGSDPWGPHVSATPAAGGDGGGKKVANTAVIIACSVVGFFVLAAAAFCAWWFWLRRKFGAGGVVEYDKKRGSRSDGHSNHGSDYSGSTLRARKHEGTMRQKSLIEGYSDYEGDSWVSETGDSIRLGHIPEVEEDGEEESKARPASGPGDIGTPPTRNSRILEDSAILDEPLPILEQVDGGASPSSPPSAPLPVGTGTGSTNRRGSSPHPRLSLASPENRSSYAQTGPYPTMSKSATSRSLSVSMSGPFPSTQSARQSTLRPDASPMYDINTSDYFQVPNRGREPRRDSRSRDRDRERTPTGLPTALNPANPFDTP